MERTNHLASWQKYSFTLEEKTFSADKCRKGLFDFNNETYHDLKLFLEDWFNDSPTLIVHTSGSTGTPKKLEVKKEQMMNSARLTCKVLNLNENDKALLCMPLQYIAGKMVVVRALVAGLDLIYRKPTGHPLQDVDKHLHFAAMVPLQVYNSLSIPEEARKLEKIDKLIIGGGAIDQELLEQLSSFGNEIYSTYGMTETLSHIALRRLNGDSASDNYQPFPTVTVSVSDEQTLIIKAPQVCDEVLKTNDVVKIYSDGTFQILGRKDNIINSGGIKIQTESVENTLRSVIYVNFALTAVPHPKFGEALVLLVEKGDMNLDSLQESVQKVLPKIQWPKQICLVESIPLTGTGKINRKECRELAKTLVHY